MDTYEGGAEGLMQNVGDACFYPPKSTQHLVAQSGNIRRNRERMGGGRRKSGFEMRILRG